MDILMEVLIEQILIYGSVFILCAVVIYFYLRQQSKTTKETSRKIEIAKEEGLFEPVSLHPFIDLSTCIGSAACVAACPEKDILGIVDGKASVVNASNCVGHGACFHACPVEAISLRIGTEQRGVDLPHVNENYESNQRGVYIAGELGGMGLIKNSVEQGEMAMNHLAKSIKNSKEGYYDAVIVGAGPAGISATLQAQKYKLKTLTLEQDSLGGTVYTFPRAKVVMTHPMQLPLYGKVKLFDTSKQELLELWNKVIDEHQIEITEHTKVDEITPIDEGCFKVKCSNGEEYLTQRVLLAIGRRGTPRKLNVPGEDLPKVAYRMLDSELIRGEQILVVGGGDSAIESAMLVMEENEVTLSYRKDKFSRLKPKNRAKIHEAIDAGKIHMKYNTNLKYIEPDKVGIEHKELGTIEEIPNDRVYIFAGGEMPTKFLEKAGVEITKRFGYIMKSYK